MEWNLFTVDAVGFTTFPKWQVCLVRDLISGSDAQPPEDKEKSGLARGARCLPFNKAGRLYVYKKTIL